MQRTNPSRLQTGLRRLRLDGVLYALLLPTLVYVVIFRVIPIWNMRLAFYNFSGRSAWTWAGLKYFEMMFGSPLMKDILLNTLIISLMKYVLLFPFFPLFAILLSEMRLGRLRKFTQVVSYLPHFLSWVEPESRALWPRPHRLHDRQGLYPLGAVLLRGMAFAGMGFHHLLYHHPWHQPVPV